MITDMNDKRIKVGDRVLVHQEEGTRESKVVRLMPDSPTKQKPGFWVDIDSGDGHEGMMSYLLEVI